MKHYVHKNVHANVPSSLVQNRQKLKNNDGHLFINRGTEKLYSHTMEMLPSNEKGINY